MEFKREDVITGQKYEFCTISEFIKTYHPGLSLAGVSHGMNKDRIDYMRLGNDRMVLLTEKTMAYKPALNYKRDARIRSTLKL